MAEHHAATIHARLGSSGQFSAWADGTPEPDRTRSLVLPDDPEADALMERLGVRSGDRVACLAARPDPDAHPDAWWILERAYEDLRARMGMDEEGYRGWPRVPEQTGDVGRQVYIWACLAAVPDVRRYHRERGVPDAVSWATLAGLGYEIAQWSEIEGRAGLAWTWMLPLLFRGRSYRLGRHVFDRGSGDLNVHIPGGQPLEPAASEASFAWAREFFPRHFPDEPVTGFSCHSWLLDEQLADYLPETSNIICFQRRFALEPEEADAHPASGDGDILAFVFRRQADDAGISEDLLAVLPQDTTLRRAFVQHLRSGGHWRTRSGRFDV